MQGIHHFVLWEDLAAEADGVPLTAALHHQLKQAVGKARFGLTETAIQNHGQGAVGQGLHLHRRQDMAIIDE